MVDVKKSVVPGKKTKQIESPVDDTLSGMKAICNYVHRTEPTVVSLVRSCGFPAYKVGGIWESRKGLIDAWREAYLNNEIMAS